MTRKWLVSIFAATALMVSPGVMAQALSGAYVGLDVGTADIGPDDDTAFKLFVGGQFHPNFGVELGFAQLFDKGAREITALEIDGVGFFPLAPQLSAIGKIGFARIDRSPGEDDNEFTFGLGIQYEAGRNVAARLQWQRYTTDPDIDLFTVGIVFKF